MFGLSASAAAALGAGAATIGGALITSNATSKAAKTQSQSTARALAQEQANLDRTYADQLPYRTLGTNALVNLSNEISKPTSAADVMTDPGYQFGLEQGQQAIDRKIAAMGGRVSGAAIKAAGRFGVGAATAGYTAADQRRQDRLNRLAALAGIGQTATNASAAAGTAAATNASNLITAQGNASAGAMVAQGNTWANTGNQLAALYGRSQTPSATPNSFGGAAGGGWGSGTGYGNQDLGGYF